MDSCTHFPRNRLIFLVLKLYRRVIYLTTYNILRVDNEDIEIVSSEHIERGNNKRRYFSGGRATALEYNYMFLFCALDRLSRIKFVLCTVLFTCAGKFKIITSIKLKLWSTAHENFANTLDPVSILLFCIPNTSRQIENQLG